MAKTYQVTVVLNNGSVGQMLNKFTCHNAAATVPVDSVVLSHMTQWINNIFATLRPFLGVDVTHSSSWVSEMNANGTVARLVGFITPTVSGTGGADGEPGQVALSMSPRTAVPKVRGGKRFSGVVENSIVAKLFVNSALSAGAAAFAYWASGVAFPGVATYVAGVLSSKVGGFVPFAGGGTLKNVPGTQTTRKALRGF